MLTRRIALLFAFVLTASLNCQFKKEGLASPSTIDPPQPSADAAPDITQSSDPGSDPPREEPPSGTTDASAAVTGGATGSGGASAGGSGGTGGTGGSDASDASDSVRPLGPDALATPDTTTIPDSMPAGAIDERPRHDGHDDHDGRDGSITADAGWTLVWADEFDATIASAVDSQKWTHITWNPRQVNGEIQKYTSRLDNVFQDGEGHLVLRALNSPYEGFQYTSGRVETNGKFSFKFGRVEVRAKLPRGIGSFPGIVLLGTAGNWPQCGELALMEQYGQDKRTVLSTVFAGGLAAGDVGPARFTFSDAVTASADFHVYSVEWYADHVVFQVDGAEVVRSTFPTSSPLFSVPEYIVLDVALGGEKGGAVKASDFPMEMVVDYVRVYSFQ